MVSKSVVGGSVTAMKKKTNIAKPSQASNGKIQKNRANDLSEKINKYLEIQSKVRLCFVNIKRDSSLLPTHSSSEIEVNNASSQTQLTTTLQDQCTVGKYINTVDKTSVAKNYRTTNKANSSSGTAQHKTLNIHKTAKGDQNNNKASYVKTNNNEITTKDSRAKQKDADVFQTQDKTETAFAIRKCVVKLRKLPKSSQAQESYARNAAKDVLLASQIISPNLDHEKRNAFRKLSLSVHKRSDPKDDNDKSGKQQSVVKSKVCNNKMSASNSNKSQKPTSLQNQKAAFNSTEKSASGIKECQPQQNSRSSNKQPTITTDIEQHKENKENRNANKKQNRVSNNCKTISSDEISCKNVEKMSKDNLIENECIDTSSSCRHENQPKRTARYGQFCNARNAKEKILDSNKLRSDSNNASTRVPLVSKDQNIAANKTNKKLCILLRNTATKTNKKLAGSEKSSLDEASASPNKDFQSQRNSTLYKEDLPCSPKLSSNDGKTPKDAPNNKCISPPGKIRTRQYNASSNRTTDPKLSTRKEKEYNNLSSECSNINNIKEQENHNERIICPSPQTPSVKETTTTSSKELQSKEKGPNAKRAALKKDHVIMNTPTILDFQPQRNSTMHFEHVTEIQSNVGKTVKAGGQDNHIAEISVSMAHSDTTGQNYTKATNKTHKFFHRHEAESSQRTVMTATNHVIHPNTKKTCLLPKRSSQIRREKVYDFLSQSQTSDSDGIKSGTKNHNPTDPTADIVKKLIAEGKVVVATRKKGKGKPTLKRKNKPKLGITKKALAGKRNYNAVHNKNPSKTPTENPGTPFIAEEEAEGFVDDHFMDNADDDEPIFVDKHYNTIQKHSNMEQTKNGLSRNLNVDHEGTFSNLARSVLINQAGRSGPQLLKAQRLLSMVKKLISTPKNKSIPSIRTINTDDFSPIQPMIRTRPVGKPSPWRVDEDAHLPRIFNFTRSSGNLPSFSSDYIPPTPRKEKPYGANKSKRAESEEQNAQSASSPPWIMQGIDAIPSRFSTPLATDGVNSSLPSFSSNDSNAENKTPPGQDKQANDENANIFNLKQLPNPRRALNYRSPLKAINITEVVQLASLDMSKVLNVNPQIAAITTNKELSNNKRLKSVDAPKEDLFGFEDFLSQTEYSTQDAELEARNDLTTCKEPTETINEKRHGLRKFKPDTSELQLCLQRTAAEKTTAPKNQCLFTDARFVKKSQKSVKEMLCSTMLHENQSTGRKAHEEQRNRADYRKEGQSNTSEMLFKDIEPETTLNEADPHRTYRHLQKRKRRLNDKRLIYSFESGESDNEDNDSAGKKKTDDNRSHETDTSSEKQPPNKKKKRQRKENPELTLFIHDFNEMCKDVDNYKLIVE